LDSVSAEELVKELIKETDIDRGLAVQIVNSMPRSIPEVRTFLGRQRIIAEESITKILRIIEKYRMEE
jgi:DNA-directed RNA polymerase subunit F